jgi:polyisoprenyl-phosphate glycosyltransferase
MIDLSIIFPCYNEEKNLALLIKKIIATKKKNYKTRIEFILVNNGSTDNTVKILNKLNHKKLFKVINIKKNLGYGGGILKGLFSAKGKIISWTHADLQCEPNDILKSIHTYRKEIYNKNSIIKGKRINRRILDNFFSICMAHFASVIFGKKFNDVNAQPKIFNRTFLKYLKKAPKDFSLDLFFLFMAKKKLYQILEYPVYYKKRFRGIAKGGDSFLGKLLLSIRTFKFIISLKMKVIWKS